MVSVVRFASALAQIYSLDRFHAAASIRSPFPFCSVSLQVCLKYYEYEFMELACQCPAVVCCRCTPTQKAQIVRLLQERTGKLTCAVGGSSSHLHASVSVTNISSTDSVCSLTVFVALFITSILVGSWWFHIGIGKKYLKDFFLIEKIKCLQ